MAVPITDRAVPVSAKSASLASKVLRLGDIPYFSKRKQIVELEKNFWYTLEDLVDHIKDNDQISDDEIATEEPKMKEHHNSNEEVAANLIKHILLHENEQPKLLVNRKISEFEKMHYPLIAKLDQHPDVTIMNDENIPIVLIEVVSGTKKKDPSHTKNKLTFAMCELLRLLSNYCNFGSDLVVTGFTFPNWSTKGCVVKSTVQWDGLNFSETAEDLQMNSVTESIKQAFAYFKRDNSITFDSDAIARPLYFIKLSATHLNCVFNKAFNGRNVKKSDEVKQVASLSSILVECRQERKYIKVYPKQVISQLNSILHNRGNVPGFLIPEMEPIIGKMGKFEMLPHQPLKSGDAKRCLRQLVQQVGDTLCQIHKKLRVAHVDVRLPNICFDSNASAVLIDPDRIVPIIESADVLYDQYPGDLYKPRKGVCTAEEIDFMQLGLLICKCLGVEEDEPNLNDFVKLLLQGKYEPLEGMDDLPGDCTISEVLSERLT